MPAPPPRTPRSIQLAIGFMIVAAITLPALTACAKYLSGYPVTQVTWARYAGHFAFMVAVFAPRNGFAILISARPGLQLARSALHCASAAFTFAAIGAVSLATATAIFFTGPLMVTALAPLLLHERIGWARSAAVMVGFAGTLIVVRPDPTGEFAAVALLFASAAAGAAVQILSRKLAAHDRALTSNTYMVLVGFLLMSCTLPFVWRNPATATDALVFAAMGLIGGLGHYCLVRAFELAPAAVVAPLNYAQIVGAIILGYVWFGDRPDLWTWIGSAIIGLSGILVMLPDRRDLAEAARGPR